MPKAAVLAAISLITLLFVPTNDAEAKKNNAVKEVTIDCNLPGASVQDAIDNASGKTEITFAGTCVGDLTVEVVGGETVTLELLPTNVTLSELRVDGEDAPILVSGDHFDDSFAMNRSSSMRSTVWMWRLPNRFTRGRNRYREFATVDAAVAVFVIQIVYTRVD